jgi:ankyrin repeat protein
MITLDLPQPLIDQFVGAAHGDFATVKQLLEQHPALLNANASWNEHAIEAAAQTAQLDIISYLLAAGAPMDICAAAVLGRQDLVEAHLQRDPALLHAQGAHGLPLLYFPAIRNLQDMASLLLRCGADINASSPGGTTALFGAVMFNQPEMAAWLLEHGADPNRVTTIRPRSTWPWKRTGELAQLLRAAGA